METIEDVKQKLAAARAFHKVAVIERDAAWVENTKLREENTKLRELVKGLIRASTAHCCDCSYDCGPDRENCIREKAEKFIKESEVEK